MAQLTANADQLLRSARVGHLATASPEGHPHVIPVCFAFDGESVFSVLDRKPKSTAVTRLRRVRNILANPQVSLVVDHYEEDWQRLWYVLVLGRAGLPGLRGRMGVGDGIIAGKIPPIPGDGPFRKPDNQDRARALRPVELPSGVMGSFHPTATTHGVDVVFPANAGIHVSSPASVCPRVGVGAASGLEFNPLYLRIGVTWIPAFAGKTEGMPASPPDRDDSCGWRDESANPRAFSLYPGCHTLALGHENEYVGAALGAAPPRGFAPINGLVPQFAILFQ